MGAEKQKEAGLIVTNCAGRMRCGNPAPKSSGVGTRVVGNLRCQDLGANWENRSSEHQTSLAPKKSRVRGRPKRPLEPSRKGRGHTLAIDGGRLSRGRGSKSRAARGQGT